MLDVLGHADPSVLAVSVDRNHGRWKRRFRKGSDGHDNKFFTTSETPIDRGATIGTEVKRDPITFVTYTDIFLRLALHFDSFGSKTSLCAEYTTGPPLTGKAVTDGNADWLFGYRDRELTTTTRCDSGGHDVDSCSQMLTPNVRR
jgi:hypothetical protein